MTSSYNTNFQMDTLYYSNYCKHSQQVLKYLVKANMTNQLNFICIDKRARDPNNNQMYIQLENGQKVILPPNIQSVPSLLLVKQNYRVVTGEDIIRHYQPKAQQHVQQATMNSGEPSGMSLNSSNNGMNIVSEQYTFYNLTPDELSAKGHGGRRQLYNYVPANQEILTIPTPEDNYQPDKVSNSLTIDVLQQNRNQDIQQLVPKL